MAWHRPKWRVAAGVAAAHLLAAASASAAACRVDTDCDASGRCVGSVCVARRTSRDAALIVGGVLTLAGALFAAWSARRGTRAAAPAGTSTFEPLPAPPPVPSQPPPPLVTTAACVGVLRTVPGGPDIPLARGTFVLGASRASGIVLAAPTVSARHLRLEVTSAGALLVTDLGSTNGTFLNGARLPPGLRVALAHGDELGVSAGVRLRWHKR